MSLTQAQIDHLDGNGLPSPFGAVADQLLIGTLLNSYDERLTDLEGSDETAEAENTDVQIPLALGAGVADAGTWAKAFTSAGVRTVTRTANASTQGFWVEVPVRARTASGKGFKPTGVKTVYSVGTADATDIRTEVYKRTVPADGSAPSAPTLLGGDADGHYDAAHDTAAERGDDTGAPENHTSTMTLPTPAYLGDGEELLVKFVVTDPGTSVVILKDIVVLGSETLLD